MAKTLTDRTSVRVTAKSDTDANNQKKNDANNIAKALGKEGDLDDAKASSVASKLGNTITDENGTTWAKSSEVAAAAKELDGEIEAKHVGLEDTDGTLYTLNHVYSWNAIDVVRPDSDPDDPDNHKIIEDRKNINPSNVYAAFMNNGRPVLFSKELNRASYFWWAGWGTGAAYGSADYIGETINGVSYSAFCFSNNGTDINESILNDQGYFLNRPTNLEKAILGYLFGPVSTGSKVDASKSEAQIKDEIESKAWAQGKAAKINPIEPNETYIAVTDANGNPLYFLGT